MGRIKLVKVGKDSKGDYLLSIIYENNFIQIYPMENIEGFKETKKNIQMEFCADNGLDWTEFQEKKEKEKE